MTRPPFGFGPTGPADEGGDEGTGGSSGEGNGPEAPNPFAGLFGSGAGVPDLAAALHQFADMLSWHGGPVNWRLAEQSALQTVSGSDAGTSPVDEQAIREAVRLADLWLDQATALPSGVMSTEAWSRRRWIEATLPVWRQLMDPVAGRVVEAIGPALTGALPAEVAAMAAPLMGVMQQVGGVMFGAQVGQAIGNLAGEVVSSTDIGLPLGPLGRAALLPANVRDFGAGLGIAEGDVRLYLALREAAHHRLFGHVGWLRSRLLEAVEAFARGIRVDTERLDSAIRDVDPTDLQSLQQALTGGLFEPETTDEQRAALDRLETLLALVEGWVDEIVDAAAAGRLPAAAALRETVRRRRAAGGPGEQAFAALVGLQLRPRRLREAAALWHAAAEARGTEGRDRIWDHPDLLPGSDDLDHPEAFLARPADEPFDLSDLDRTQPPPEPPQEEGGEPG